MIDKKIIFIHNMFRAGSTYIFSKFRENKSFWTYYEPLHDNLVRLKKDSLDIFEYDENATKAMKHPKLTKPHFYEFYLFLAKYDNISSFYNTDFAYKEFFKVEKEKELNTYINKLLYVAPTDTIPVLQCSRSSHRINWFSKTYPKSFNIFLLRNARDQFESYLSMGTKKSSIYLAVNIYIVQLNKKSLNYLLFDKYHIKLIGNISYDLKKCIQLANKLSFIKHYEIFYYIWFHSFMHANKYADIIINMDKLNNDQEYMKEIKSILLAYSSININLDNYKLKQYKKYKLKEKKYILIERKIYQDFANKPE